MLHFCLFTPPFLPIFIQKYCFFVKEHCWSCQVAQSFICLSNPVGSYPWWGENVPDAHMGYLVTVKAELHLKNKHQFCQGPQMADTKNNQRETPSDDSEWKTTILGCFCRKMRIHLLPVNDHRVRWSLVSVATTFLLTAPTGEGKKTKFKEPLGQLRAKNQLQVCQKSFSTPCMPGRVKILLSRREN